jgi:hypothetical protein
VTSGIPDPDGDRVFAQDQSDRDLERSDSPLTHLDLERIKGHMELLADALTTPSIREDKR